MPISCTARHDARATLTAAAAAALWALAGGCAAQTMIDQDKALAGMVTPGDGPGFPVTISQPGHYRLAGNLQVPLNVNAVVIEAEDVTLDLNGHTIASSGDCHQQDYPSMRVFCNMAQVYDNTVGSKSGIRITGAGAMVRNGGVKGFRGHGISVGGGHAWFDQLRVSNNLMDGIAAGAGHKPGRVSNSHVFLNGDNGISGISVLVERTLVANNGADGVRVWGGALTDSMVVRNYQRGASADADARTSVRNTHFIWNKQGSVGTGVVSAGGNFNGAAAF